MNDNKFGEAISARTARLNAREAKRQARQVRRVSGYVLRQAEHGVDDVAAHSSWFHPLVLAELSDEVRQGVISTLGEAGLQAVVYDEYIGCMDSETRIHVQPLSVEETS